MARAVIRRSCLQLGFGRVLLCSRRCSSRLRPLTLKHAPSCPASSSMKSAASIAGARVTVDRCQRRGRPDDDVRCGRRVLAARSCSGHLLGAGRDEPLCAGHPERDGARVRIGRRRFAPCSRPADLPRASSSPPGASETRLAETPQKIEVIDATDIERSVAADLTDVLKKNAGVDVVQYSGALSGIGIRGFRPQFSGINKRSLLLIDGRPSGVTNLATLLLDNVERIEVLKGAASAVYGSSAMGGVVNVITRQSRGKIGGNARIGAGSFGASEFAGRVGGNVVVARRLRRHRQRLRSARRLPHGQRRGPAGDQLQDLRRQRCASASISPTAWRIDGRANGYRGRDIMTPGDLATGINSQGSKNLERSTGDARLTGRIGSARPVVHRLRRERGQPHLQRHDDQPARRAVSCPICRSKASSTGPACRRRIRGTGRG